MILNRVILLMALHPEFLSPHCLMTISVLYAGRARRTLKYTPDRDEKLTIIYRQAYS